MFAALHLPEPFSHARDRFRGDLSGAGSTIGLNLLPLAMSHAVLTLRFSMRSTMRSRDAVVGIGQSCSKRHVSLCGFFEEDPFVFVFLGDLQKLWVAVLRSLAEVSLHQRRICARCFTGTSGSQRQRLEDTPERDDAGECPRHGHEAPLPALACECERRNRWQTASRRRPGAALTCGGEHALVERRTARQGCTRAQPNTTRTYIEV